MVLGEGEHRNCFKFGCAIDGVDEIRLGSEKTALTDIISI